jgi:hypothetical protein
MIFAVHPIAPCAITRAVSTAVAPSTFLVYTPLSQTQVLTAHLGKERVTTTPFFWSGTARSVLQCFPAREAVTTSTLEQSTVDGV